MIGVSRSVQAPFLGVIAFVYYVAEDVMAAPIYALYSFDPQPVWIVHDVWFASLVGFCFLIGVAFKTVAVPLWMAFASFNGTEDLLYYLMQGRLPPYNLDYLKGFLMFPQPATIWTVLFGLAVSAIALPVFLKVERKAKARFF